MRPGVMLGLRSLSWSHCMMKILTSELLQSGQLSEHRCIQQQKKPRQLQSLRSMNQFLQFWMQSKMLSASWRHMRRHTRDEPLETVLKADGRVEDFPRWSY
mmetsp:Transcript_42058/g.73818  ORF Transcript_42058/g.73818 Transcript_42058/m.73818 type:complete len:101 (+) Transcript_42058:136-438(+)